MNHKLFKRKKCFPTSQIDCTEHCDVSWKHLVLPETNILKTEVSQLKNEINLEGIATGSGNSVYVGYVLGAIVIIFGIYILIKRFVRKN